MISEKELRQIDLLRELPTEELVGLIPALTERIGRKSSFLLCADDPGPSMMFLLEGSVKITLLSRDGKEIVLAQLGPGDFFGEMAVLTGEDRSANVVATEDCRYLVLGAEEFRTHLRSHSGLALALLKELALRLRGASVKIGDLALYDVFERVFRALKGLAEAKPDGTKVVDKRPTHQTLASMVGTSREMVTRALRALEEDNSIRTVGKRVEILK